jgi:hypothetical protein
MYLIPILPESMMLIAELNNGVRPEIEGARTYFVWYKDKPAEIWSEEQVIAHNGKWLGLKIAQSVTFVEGEKS